MCSGNSIGILNSFLRGNQHLLLLSASLLRYRFLFNICLLSRRWFGSGRNESDCSRFQLYYDVPWFVHSGASSPSPSLLLDHYIRYLLLPVQRGLLLSRRHRQVGGERRSMKLRSNNSSSTSTKQRVDLVMTHVLVSRYGSVAIYVILDWRKPGTTTLVCLGTLVFMVLLHFFTYGLYRSRIYLARKIASTKKKPSQTQAGIANGGFIPESA